MNRERLMRFVLPSAIVLITVVIAVVLVRSRPKASRSTPQETVTLVRVVEAEVRPESARIMATGTVIPARSVDVQPQVEGRIVEQSPKLVPGGHFLAGEIVARIDPEDYELAVARERAAVAKAEFELNVEKGRQAIARSEWALLEDEIPWTEAGRDLALRRPHMANAEAALAAAQASLQQAELDLERTTIRAPFNSVVQDEFVDVGQTVARQTRIATLVGTDTFWVEASVPVDRLRWMTFPRNGSPGSRAKIVHDTGLSHPIEREGQLIRLRGDLEPAGRMARVVVAVDDPLRLEPDAEALHVVTTDGENGGNIASPAALPLLVGAYVRVEIVGTELVDVISLPRTALRDGDRVWIMGPDDRLEVRDVEVTWRAPDHVFLGKGVDAGERVVVSAIGAPIPGMRLRARPAEAARDVSMLEPSS